MCIRDRFKDGLDVGDELETFAQVGWEQVDKTDLELRLKWYGMFWRPKTPGKFMLRLRIPNGVLNSHQIKVVASIVGRYGEDGIRDSSTSRGLGDVYKRQFPTDLSKGFKFITNI